MGFLVGTRIRAHGPAVPRPGCFQTAFDVRPVFPALFHPDFDRRLRNCTESADPAGSFVRQALAGWTARKGRHHRRWGFSPRPENVTATIGGALIMAMNFQGTSSPSIPQTGCPMAPMHASSPSPARIAAHEIDRLSTGRAYLLPLTNKFPLEVGRKRTIGGTLRCIPCTAYTIARERGRASSHEPRPIPVCSREVCTPASLSVDAESQSFVCLWNASRRGCADSANHIS
jgi:hypothetical protein